MNKEILKKGEPEGLGEKQEWVSSKAIMKTLKISACELMHKRERGEFDFKKLGNAYFYKIKP